MSLADYSYIVTLGQACTLSFQLTRAAERYKLPPWRCQGPFDWLFLDVGQVIQCVSDDFRQYFRLRTIRISEIQDPNDGWRVVDAYGIQSAHQMLRQQPTESAPTVRAWFQFGRWLGARHQSWREKTSDSAGNVLFLRLEADFGPDEQEEILRLWKVLAGKVAGKCSLAWIRYAPAPPLVGFDHPHIRVFEVRRTWPPELKGEQINWLHDYGMGLAWRGYDPDWDAVWNSL